MRKKVILLLFCCVPLKRAFAAVEDNQVWLNFTLHGQFGEGSNLGGSLEVQSRHSNLQQRTYENILRPALFYKAGEYGSFHLGYLTRSNSENKEVERRPWAQWSKSYSFDEWKFATRARYESRDLYLAQRSERIRVMGRSTLDHNLFWGFKPLASVELFYNLNDVAPSIQTGMKQSRISLGVTQKFESNLTAEFLITKNYIDLATSEDQENNVLHIVFIKDF